MGNNFEKYVTEWFHDYVKQHEDDENLLLSIFNTLVCRLEDDSIDEYLLEGQTIGDYLINNIDAQDIYSKWFKSGAYREFDRTLDDQLFVLSILQKSVEELGLDEYDFVPEFIQDMAYHICDYSEPIGFFKDLSCGGCVSGMIGMLIYHNDCLELYGKYAVSMENYKEYLEDELGEPIRQRNGNKTYHYTWMCWLCYEEVAYSIARHLFENDF